jgi:hypothetical protein
MVTGGATTGGTNHLNAGRDSTELTQEEEEISRGLGKQQRLGESRRRCVGRISHGLEEQRSSSMKKSLSMICIRSSSSASRHLRRRGDSYNLWVSPGDRLRRGRKE